MERSGWIAIGGTLLVGAAIIIITMQVAEVPPAEPRKVPATTPRPPAAPRPEAPPISDKERAVYLLTYAKSDCAHPSAARITRAIAKHPEWKDRDVEAIACGTIAMGMSEDEVRASWGAPQHINETQLPRSRTAQWVYPANYVYFDDGIVTSWQSSR
jgi:hypothetical protein